MTNIMIPMYAESKIRTPAIGYANLTNADYTDILAHLSDFEVDEIKCNTFWLLKWHPLIVQSFLWGNFRDGFSISHT